MCSLVKSSPHQGQMAHSSTCHGMANAPTYQCPVMKRAVSRRSSLLPLLASRGIHACPTVVTISRRAEPVSDAAHLRLHSALMALSIPSYIILRRKGKDGSAKNFPCTERRNHVTPNSNRVARLPKACEARSSLKAAPCLRTKYRTRCLMTDCLAGSKPASTNEASTDVVHSKWNAIQAAVAVTASKAANLVLEQSTDAQH